MSSPAGERRFTEEVRQELARLPVGAEHEVRAELATLFRVAGSLTVAGGDPFDGERIGLGLTTGSGAVARRAYTLLTHGFRVRPDLLVREPGGMQHRARYGVRLAVGAGPVARTLGLLDAAGRPVDGLPAGLEGTGAVACARGALLGAGSVSGPGRPPHLEVATRTHETAEGLAAVLHALVGEPPGVVGDERVRVVLKSGAAIADLLAALGATRAFLTYDDGRLRRQLRSEANRLANADAANLRRSIEGGAAQVRAVEVAIARVGWHTLNEDLRATALVRLANPAASLAELGSLLDPPVGKSAVHRRLRRLEALGHDEHDATGPSVAGRASPFHERDA